VEAVPAAAEYDLFNNQMLGFFGRQGSVERPLTSSRLQGAALYRPQVLSAPASAAATVGVAGPTARAAVRPLKPAARLLTVE